MGQNFVIPSNTTHAAVLVTVILHKISKDKSRCRKIDQWGASVTTKYMSYGTCLSKAEDGNLLLAFKALFESKVTSYINQQYIVGPSQI